MSRISAFKPTAAAAFLACLAIATAGCERTDDQRSVGQKLDSAVATTERKADEAKDSIKQAGRDASQTMGKAADQVALASSDLAITAAVKTRLASDSELSALAINVDTSSGRVVLRGSAPDTASRNRATELARTVEGVSSVDNELNVQAKL